MVVKKIAAVAGATAMLLSVAVPAMAYSRPWSHRHGSADVAVVENGASAYSDTGYNVQGNSETTGKKSGVTQNNTMTTGNANAQAVGAVVANTHVGCGCEEGEKSHHKDVAMVKNGASADAYTGDNVQGNSATTGKKSGVTQNNTMRTGNADSKAAAVVVVNTHWSGSM